MRLGDIYFIAKDEWRYWFRSRLSLSAIIAASLLLVASLVNTAQQVQTESATREGFQQEAVKTFESQPARHPHRMIHYGHYIFRTPTPLSVIDLGVDASAGTVMFLEGHRQNSTVFPPNYSNAYAGQLADLSPAFAYQMLVPLLLIILGYASISRERELGTEIVLYSIAVTPMRLWLGKTLALGASAVITLTPLVVGLSFAVSEGEPVWTAAYMFLGYATYLLTWVFIITATSAFCERSASAFTTLLGIWIVLCVISAPLASSIAETGKSYEGKVASDIAVQQALRGTGDGHNEADIAFNQLRAELLRQYEVKSVENLPFNIRGIISLNAEETQTKILNRFSDQRMQQAKAQTQVIYWLGLLSPTLALKNFSVNIAGTSLSEYQRFQRQAERVRFDFVQKLNTMHAEQLTYDDDIKRSIDPLSEQRTRIDSHHWKILDATSHHESFEGARISESFPHFLALIFWCFFAAIMAANVAKKGDKNVA